MKLPSMAARMAVFTRPLMILAETFVLRLVTCLSPVLMVTAISTGVTRVTVDRTIGVTTVRYRVEISCDIFLGNVYRLVME